MKSLGKNSSGKPLLYGPWYNWSSSITTFRLSLALVVSTMLFLPLPAPSNYQIIALLSIVAGYSSIVTVVLLIKPSALPERRQAILICLLMLLFIITATLLFEREALAVLVFIPVLNAALRLAERNLIITVVLAGVSWVGLNAQTGLPTVQRWAEIVAVLVLLVLVAVIVRSLRGDIDLARNRITALSYQDELSGTLNMRAFTRLLLSVQAKAVESGTPYALIMIDIENLQLLNEKYGHEQGNRVIVAVAEALKRSIRTDDLIARYGGDEFMVYLAGASDEIAQEISNRITQNVYNITLSFESKMQRIQVNTGVAIYPDSGSTIQEMMTFADKAMYQDKEFRRRIKPAGSNRDKNRAQAGIEPL
jgi:diguanylate cyclase (GGDEF)-like protein